MNNYLKILAILIFIFVVGIGNAEPVDRKKILCFLPSKKHQASSHLQNEVLKQLKKRSIDIVGVTLISSELSGNAIRRNIDDIKPDIILTSETSATFALMDLENKIPIFFSMIYQTDVFLNKIKLHENVKGSFINLNMQNPLALIKNISPDTREIGVIHSICYFQDSLKDFVKYGEKLGFRIKTFGVKKASDIPEVINNPDFNFQALYLLPDPILMNKPIYKKIILESHQKHFFVFGDSFKIVGDGSLISFEFDIEEQITNITNLIIEYIQTGSMKALENKNAQKFDYYLNLETARRYDISIPREICKKAKMIYNK